MLHEDQEKTTNGCKIITKITTYQKTEKNTGNNCYVTETFLFWSSIAPLADTCLMVALCLSPLAGTSRKLHCSCRGIQSSSFGVTRNSQLNSRSYSFAFEECLTQIGGILQLVSYTINPSMPRIEYYTMSDYINITAL